MEVKVDKRKRDEEDRTVLLETADDAKGGGGRGGEGEMMEGRILRRFERRFVRRTGDDFCWGDVDGVMTWTEVLTLRGLLMVVLNWWCWVEIGRDAYAFFSDLHLRFLLMHHITESKR